MRSVVTLGRKAASAFQAASSWFQDQTDRSQMDRRETPGVESCAHAGGPVTKLPCEEMTATRGFYAF